MIFKKINDDFIANEKQNSEEKKQKMKKKKNLNSVIERISNEKTFSLNIHPKSPQNQLHELKNSKRELYNALVEEINETELGPK